ncbi:MAG: J domain-containing protein [Patescibacteria group bacterium]|jgi:curved DNA-binding protein CbpA
MDAIQGLDYLIDYYALLGVARDASSDDLHRAYREKQLQYHPDRYEGLAPEMKQAALEKSRLIVEAYRLLSDPAARQAYDAKLAAWDGPVSANGLPIIDLSRPRFRPETLFEGEGAESGDKSEAMARQFSGHDEAMFSVIEKMYQASPEPTPEVAEAYRQALAKKDLYLSLKEGLAWNRAGIENQPVDEQADSDHVATVERRLEEARAQVKIGAERTLQLCAAGEIKLLGDGGAARVQTIKDDPAGALALYQAQAEKRFDAAAGEIREAAKVRAEVAAQRLEAVAGVYDPPQPEMFPRLAVRMQAGGKAVWLAFCLTDTASIGPDDGVSAAELAKLDDPEAARLWIAGGANILRLEFQEGLELKSQLERAVLKHFERLV